METACAGMWCLSILVEGEFGAFPELIGRIVMEITGILCIGLAGIFV